MEDAMTAPRKPARTAPSAFMRGEQGRSNTDNEIALSKQKAEQRKANANKPFRFYVPIGDTRRIIVCDETPDFFLYEHALKDAEGRWGRLFTGCVKTFDNCPVCEATARESYYAMVLTIIDLTPFPTRDGDTVEFSRKLLIVKPAQQKKFLRFFAKEGTLRGAMFDMTRDGDKDPAIGNDIEFVEFVEEDELATFHRSWKDKEGKKHEEDCDEVYAYEELFEEPTTELLRAVVGGQPAAGSREADNRALGRTSSPSRPSRSEDDWEDDVDTKNYDGAKSSRTKPAPAAATRRGRVAEAAEEDEEDEEEAAPVPASRRGKAPAADAPAARRGAAKKAAEVEEDDEEEDEGPPFDTTPQSRRTTPVASRAPATAPRRGRAAEVVEDDDEEEEEAAPEPAPTRRGRARG
jgi:hypothetical protein